MDQNSKTNASNTDIENNKNKLAAKKHFLTKLFPFSKKITPIPLETPEAPESNANILSYLYFHWMQKIISTGYNRRLEFEDLPLVAKNRRVNELELKFNKNFKKRINCLKKKSNKDYATLLALNDTFFWEFWIAGILKCLGDCTQAIVSILSRKIIEFTINKYQGIPQSIGNGIGMAIGMALLLQFSSICTQHYFFHTMMVGAQARSVLISSIYKKSLKLSNKSHLNFTNGKITSMMSADAYKLEFSCRFFHHLWDSFILIGVCIVILLVNIGYSSLAGIAVMFIVAPILTIISKNIIKNRIKVSNYTDERIRIISEIIQAMRIIKYYTWENPYLLKILNIRRKEMNLVRKILIIRNGTVSIAITLPILSSMIAFIVLSVTNHHMNPATIFSSLTLFNNLRLPLILYPVALTTFTDAIVAMKRVNKLLTADEINSNININQNQNYAIIIDNASFLWDDSIDSKLKSNNSNLKIKKDKQLNKPTIHIKKFNGLNNIKLNIKKGEFIVITGAIGTGKTSLLSAIAGSMPQLSGTTTLSSSLCYCSNPWIQNLTLRDNILFGQPFHEKKYRKVLKSCALEQDIISLPYGDMTEIGERGITISGGQKARINLARAAYVQSEIILMDDVLSAVDAHVGKVIIEECIMGFMKGSTRLLATHQLHVLDYADRVIFTPGDGSVIIGTLDELKASNNEFRSLLMLNVQSMNEEEKIEQEEDAIETYDLKNIEQEKKNKNLPLSKVVSAAPSNKKLPLSKVVSAAPSNKKLPLSKVVSAAPSNEKIILSNNDGKNLIVKEKLLQSSIKWKVYKAYFSNGSKYLSFMVFPIIVFLVILATGTMVLAGLWLSFWTSDKFHETRGFYVGILVMLTVCASLFFFLYSAYITFSLNRSSRVMNVKAVERIMRAPMEFFDTTPVGRILNRFSKDTDIMDNNLSDSYRMFIQTFASIIASFILAIAYFYYFVIAIVVLAIGFVLVADFYRESAREIKRLEAVTRSVLFAHFNESLTGITQIRAYGAIDRFIYKNEEHINKTNRAYYLTIANQRWLGTRIDIFGICLVFIVSMLAVTSVLSVGASAVGVVLAYIISVMSMMSWMVTQLAEVENNMNATERIYEYAYDLKEEAPLRIDSTKPPTGWPSKGTISFQNLSFRYREGLPLVLKNLNFVIKGGEKIGICGRTGAGKSSILSTLFRLSEIHEGKILIDDIDISGLGLHDLREKLSIIPQDPTLFKGTIRTNLDPFETATDEQLWEALRRAGAIDTTETNVTLKDVKDDEKVKGNEEKSVVVNTLQRFHLDRQVEDEGGNFSLGERQLLSLARALVHSTRILIMDEATSSVDYETDEKIQKTIATEFNHCTILCIAHRLRTILNYDKILVLEKGEVAEFDSPFNLFKSQGIFHGMCVKASINEEDFKLFTGK